MHASTPFIAYNRMSFKRFFPAGTGPALSLFEVDEAASRKTLKTSFREPGFAGAILR
jgi:hypothetical protein